MWATIYSLLPRFDDAGKQRSGDEQATSSSNTSISGAVVEVKPPSPIKTANRARTTLLPPHYLLVKKDLSTQVCVHIVSARAFGQEKSTQVGVMTVRSAKQLAMREKILKVADRLFYMRGIRAVGVDTIAAEIGISKRTLYDYFPSKNDIIAAYLLRRIRPPEPVQKAPADEILDEFDRLGRSFASNTFRGCPFVNAVTELGEPAHEANKIAIAFKEQRRNWFRELLVKLGVSDSDSLSMQFMLLVDGAVSAALVHREPRMAIAAREAATVLLAARGIFPSGDAARGKAVVGDRE